MTTPKGKHARYHLSLLWRSPAVVLTALTPRTGWEGPVHSGHLLRPVAPAPRAWHLGTLVLLKFCPLAPHVAPRPTLCPSCPALLEIHFQTQSSVISFPARIISRVFKSVPWNPDPKPLVSGRPSFWTCSVSPTLNAAVGIYSPPCPLFWPWQD